jgi:hypothetical protein
MLTAENDSSADAERRSATFALPGHPAIATDMTNGPANLTFPLQAEIRLFRVKRAR